MSTSKRSSAETIRDMRLRAGLSQEALARLLPVPVATLRNWEQGIREPSEAMLHLVRRVLADITA